MKSKHLKIMTILGTRPEIIRLSRIMALLDQHTDHIIVHTGQNYDYELNEIFYKDLSLRPPDHFLNIRTSTVGLAYGETLIRSEKVIIEENPDAVLILGDTNSSIACIIAKRYKIPVFHMEAGNRCFDYNVPEEINRRIIDHIADINLVYSEHARRNLMEEGFPARRIYLTGSPMYEVLNYYHDRIAKSTVRKKLGIAQNEYFLVSIHREENVNNTKIFSMILDIIVELKKKYRKKIVVTTHPRTQKQLAATKFKVDKDILFLKPFCFTDYICLQKNALCVISDSGTISEESAILNFPAITLRSAMERPEAMDAGTIMLTGFDTAMVINSIEYSIHHKCMREIPKEYLVPNTSDRVVKIILSLAKLVMEWNNIKTLSVDDARGKQPDLKK